jgi:hypothetical protein
MSEVKTLIQKLAGTHRSDTVRVFDAVVNSVNVSGRTCEVTMIGGESSNVLTARLMASVDDGCFIVPKANSTVIVTMSDYVQPYVSMFSEVERIEWLGGDYDGVPIVTHPTDTTKGLYKRMQKIETKLNDHISKYNAHRHITSCGAGAGTANSVIVPDIDTALSPLIAQSDIEHPNITH